MNEVKQKKNNPKQQPRGAAVNRKLVLSAGVEAASKTLQVPWLNPPDSEGSHENKSQLTVCCTVSWNVACMRNI